MHDDLWTTVWQSLPADALPGDLSELVRDVGRAGCRRLVERMPGSRIYVPERVAPHEAPTLFDVPVADVTDLLTGDLEDVAERVGVGIALALAQHWYGALLYVPSRSGVIRAYRDRHLLDEYEQGDTMYTLAARYQISTERVRQLLREASRPGNLFDD